MRRSFKAIAEKLINARHSIIRRRVRVALEEAYRTGLDDAAAEVEAAAREQIDRIRQLGRNQELVAQPSRSNSVDTTVPTAH